MAEQLPDQFVRARICVEGNLGGQMAELMRSNFHSQVPQNSLLDRTLYCLFRFALKGDKHRIGAHADHRRGDLVPIDMETVGEGGGKLDLEDDIVLGFVGPECEECRLAAPLRPMQMLVELQGGQVLHAHGHVKEKVDRERTLQVDERPP